MLTGWTEAIGADLRKNILVDTLALDYVTIVSSNWVPLQHTFAVLAKQPGDVVTGNINRPERNPLRCDGMYLGPVPRQKNNDNLMLQVPGLRSEYAASKIDCQGSKSWCTRFDLQVTIPVAYAPDISELYNILSNPDVYPWQQPGKVPGVTRMVNSEGGETLYIGARTSDIMQRIYKKEVDGMPYMRWELECKGRLARSLAKQGILVDRDMRATFARSVLAGLPGEAEQLTLGFAEQIGKPTGEVKRSGFECQDDATMRWLRMTAIPALKRACEGHLAPEVIRMMKEEGIPLARKVEVHAD